MTAYHYGYARVSTSAQDLTRQLDYLTKQGVPAERIHADKKSGTDFEREGLAAVLAALRPGDVLHVAALDRLGRSLLKMLGTFEHITKTLGAHIVAGGALPVDTRNGGGELAVLLLAFVSEVELIFQRERRASARASKESRGVKWGRPASVDGDAVRESFAEGLTARQVMALHGISRATAFRLKAGIKTDAVAVETPEPVVADEPPSVLPDALPTAGLTEARRYAALAGIGADDKDLGEILAGEHTPHSERSMVTSLVFARYMNTPAVYEEWRKRVAAYGRTGVPAVPAPAGEEVVEPVVADEPAELHALKMAGALHRFLDVEETAGAEILAGCDTAITRRGRGYSATVTGTAAMHRELLSTAWVLEDTGSDNSPAERTAYRAYADLVAGLPLAGQLTIGNVAAPAPVMARESAERRGVPAVTLASEATTLPTRESLKRG